MEYRACRRSIEKLARFALVRPTVLEARIEVTPPALQARHAIREANFDQAAFAHFLACECGEEVHEISRMIPLFHIGILTSSRGSFCVNRIAIFKIDVHLYVVRGFRKKTRKTPLLEIEYAERMYALLK